ncbi:hypothetical protein B0T20DRAFT_349591 [Sordaria brevicollis]|uniref:SUN domain-containing protein n=1 Tax=Sordaria brevicollis TaxID=83679 RepID=A0AAE0PHV9_SORBR|nr:hypothetical protein B0T20DRAFT_349591 [Sordaria brevicollis]
MPPRRIARRSVASPSPVPSDGGTPKPGKQQRNLRVPVEQVRNQTPTRFSLSYGSSLVAIPDRYKTAAGLGLEAAFAGIGETVRTDNIKAERRRRELDARRGSTTPGPRRPEPIEEETEEEEEEEMEEEEEEVKEKEEDYDDQGGYYDEEEEEDSELERQRAEEEEREREEEEERERAERAAAAAAAERERKRLEKERKDKAEREKAERALKAAREAEEREAKKRAREEEEEEEAERAERAERAARLRRERAEEARRQAEQKHAEEARQAARREEEQRQAREAAMRPPSPPSKRVLSTPPTAKRRELVPPDTGNSYIEESDVYNDSEKALEEERRRAQQRRLAAQYTPEPPEPPRIARRPVATLSNSLPLAQFQVDQNQDSLDTLDTATEPIVSDKSYPSFGRVSQPTTPKPSRTSRPESEQSNTTNGKTPPPPYTPAPTFMQRSLNLIRRSLWVAWKLLTYLVPLLLIALVVLSATSYGSPDSEKSIRWYGWKHWRSNIGQFIPSHPQLTDDQFNDLKNYILEQSSSTESAVKNIQTLLPRMVHVKRGPNGDLIIQDDFWHALLDKMLKDSSVLTLNSTGDISEEHWDALRARFIKVGLFEKGPSDEHTLQLTEGTISKSWERWVAKNGEKVAQVVKEHLPGHTGDGVTRDAAISRDEFVGLLKKRIAEHKEDIDGRLDTVKKGLETLVNTTVKAAIEGGGGLSKSEITTLIRNIVQKEIPRAQLEAAAKDGIMRNYHDYIETQVNHFGLGNQAGIVHSESSPTYRQGESHVLPGHKHLSNLFGKAKPITSKDQTSLEAEYMLALSTWTDVGQAWCAGITASRGAELAVEMANIIIPQVVVVEHVHPNATTDRGSMPKDIEIWGYYPDPDDNKRLLKWMDELYPGEREADLKRVDADDKKKSLSLVNKKYVKIGELEYDYAKTSGNHGMFVHKLSEELLELDAATYKVLIRAKTNHGSPDHTCFYRLQLFGEEVEFENGN